MSDTRTTMPSAEADRLHRISMEAHGVTGMLNAVLEAAPSYSHSQLLRVIKTAHDRLETACRREEGEVSNG
jgi:hypothetical protein